MFFPERIISISDTDRVLEVGPGGTPYHRSDVLLEKVFDDDEAYEQRGHVGSLETNKKLVFYEGKKFPFKDNEFDYVICSHVLEHIPSDEVVNFLSEVQRVANKGYLEFPTIYYDYIYNFPKHMTFLLYDDGIIKYLGKEKTQLSLFKPVQEFFYNSASAGHISMTQSLKNYFFQGFEWHNNIQTKEVSEINEVCYAKDISESITLVTNQSISCKQKLVNKIKNIWLMYKRLIYIHVLRDRFIVAHKKWVKDKGDMTLRLNYDLNSESIVFDLGGYHGDFAQRIFDKYNSIIYIFEPVKSFYDEIVKRFENNGKVHVFNFGLSDKDSQVEISLSADGSSIFTNTENKETILLNNIISFLREHRIQKIDLFKINIEGGEFEVLPILIDNEFVENITDLQIQFHTFVKDAKFLRNKIRNRLSKTHQLTYDYWFIWENWRLKNK